MPEQKQKPQTEPTLEPKKEDSGNLSTSDNIPTHIHPIYTPESLTPTVVCDLREIKKKKKIRLHPSTAQFHCSQEAEVGKRHGNQPSICSIFHPFPYYQTRRQEKSPRNLPRLQDDQKENADNKVSGSASASDKPRRMADGAILAQVFHPRPPSTQAEKQSQTVLNTNP